MIVIIEGDKRKKLTTEAVQMIRILAPDFTKTQIARAFGVSVAHVRDIVKGFRRAKQWDAKR